MRVESKKPMESDHYEKFFYMASDPMCIAGANGYFQKVNPAFCRILGYSATELVNSPYLDFVHPDDLQSTRDEAEKQLAGGVTLEYENRWTHKEGHIIWLSWHSVFDRELNIHYAVANDITERKRVAAQMARTQLMMERTERVACTGSWEWDIASDTVTWSAETYRFFGRDPALGVPNLEGQKDLYTPESTQLLAEVVSQAVSDGIPYNIELHSVRPNGEKRYCQILGFPERDDSGKIVRLAGSLQDITERKQAEELIWKQANFDELTQLPNRRLFHDRLKQDIKKAHRAHSPLALLFIDLDDFKEVNDTLGHATGDTLLVEAAKRITGCMRETDTVARLGGDEFTVLLTELHDVNNVERVASAILKCLLEPFNLGDHSVIISASIGITLYPNDGIDSSELLKSADQAMYAAKRLGRNRFNFLKIDRSFVQNLAPGSSDMALSEAIIVMAHKLGLRVIAEGVETVEQRDLLIAAGCDFAQGYLFSRPVTAEEIEKLIRTQK